MEILTQATTKYIRISPKKMRDVARLIRGLQVSKAMDLLKMITQKGARELLKTLKSAAANAENNHNANLAELIVSKAVVNQGSTFRRFRPAARGSAHPYVKHTSHIIIELSEGSSRK